MEDRSQIEALADALLWSGEVTLGPTDTTACAAALKYCAKSRARKRAIRKALIATVGVLAVSAMLVSRYGDLNGDGRLNAEDAHMAVGALFENDVVTRTLVFEGRSVTISLERPKLGRPEYRVLNYQFLVASHDPQRAGRL